jgi:hypothetical protein
MAKSGLLGSLGSAVNQFNTNPLGVIGVSARSPDDEQLMGMAAPGQIASADSWHPHNPTVLGALADAFLMSRGMKPAFAEEREKQNYEEAMTGFMDNPVRAINRMVQVDPSAAFKMYNIYEDNLRQRDNLGRQNDVLQFQKDRYVFNQAANMMGAANAQTWPNMKQQILNFGKKYGTDLSSYLPDEYNPDDVEMLRQGAIPVAKQEQIAETNRHNTTREDQQQQSITERTRHDQVREGQMQQGITERNRHNQVTEAQAETNEQGRNNRSKVAQQQNSKFVNTPRGPMSLSPSGMTGQIVRDDGTVEIWQKASPGHWVKIDEKKPGQGN